MRKELLAKNILNLTWPTIVSYSILIIVGIIDLLFIRTLGTIAVATAATANSFMVGFYAFMEGFKSGTTVLTAKYFGAKDKQNVSKTLNIALFYSIIIGLALMLLSPIIAKAIYFIIADNEIRKANNFYYLQIRLLAAPLILILYALIGFFNGLKQTRIPLYLTLITLGSNIILNFALVWGNFGFYPLNIPGAAIATLLSLFIGTLIGFIFLYENKFSSIYIMFKLGYKKIKHEYLKTAFDIGTYAGMLSIALLFFIAIFSKLGSQALAVHQITFQVLMVSYLIPSGFFVTASILIGKIIGEKKYNIVIRYTSKIILISISLVALVSFTTFTFSHYIAHFLIPTNSYVANLTSISIKILSIERIIGTIYLVLKGALTGAEDTRFIVIATICTSYLFFIPTAYALGITLNYGVTGGYVAYLCWSTLDCLILCWRFFINKSWQKN